MTTAVQVTFNGNGATVTRDTEAALRHVADILYETRGDAAALRGAVERNRAEYADLAAAGANVSLAHMLSMLIRTDRPDLAIGLIVHDLDAKPGTTTARRATDMAEPAEVGFHLAEALARVSLGGHDPDDVARELRAGVTRAISGAKGAGGTAEDAYKVLRDHQVALGSKDGDVLSVIPKPSLVAGRHQAFVDGLPDLVVGRFREVAAALEPRDAPAP